MVDTFKKVSENLWSRTSPVPRESLAVPISGKQGQFPKYPGAYSKSWYSKCCTTSISK